MYFSLVLLFSCLHAMLPRVTYFIIMLYYTFLLSFMVGYLYSDSVLVLSYVYLTGTLCCWSRFKCTVLIVKQFSYLSVSCWFCFAQSFFIISRVLKTTYTLPLLTFRKNIFCFPESGGWWWSYKWIFPYLIMFTLWPSQLCHEPIFYLYCLGLNDPSYL